jgi:hypothetical protein
MAVLLLAGELFLPFAVLVGAAVYLVVSVLLRTISREDARLLLSYLVSRAERPAQTAPQEEPI